MSVFVDTSAFLAVIDSGDEVHQQAAQVWKMLVEREETLISSSYVLVETTALIQHRLGLNALKQFQENVFPLLQIA